MKIHIYKSKTIQVEDFQPVRFEYGLEDECPTSVVKTRKEDLEKMVDQWIEEETTKVLDAKKLKENHGMLPPATDDIPF
jgi:hypothetical protein